MAQYNPTIALGQLKGSIGGTTFQGGNNSSIIRSRTYKRGSNSAIRSVATNNLGSFATLWRGLSPADKAGWGVLATSYTFINKFGRPYFGSAYQVFVSLNTYSISLIGIYYARAPTTIIPATPFPIVSLVIHGARIITTWTTAPIVNTMAKFYATAPMSAGRNDNHPKLRLISSVDITSLTNLDIATEYTNQFPFPAIGQKVIIKMVVSDFDYPFPYFPQIFSSVCY